MSKQQLVQRMRLIRDLSQSDDSDRYIRFAEDVLGVRLADQQREILRSLAEHKRTVIMSGNGPGKSYGVALAKLAFLVCNVESIVMGTSGSYSQYTDAVWRPMKSLYKDRIMPLDPTFPEPNDSQQPTIELEDEWYAKVVSPRDPGDLEGRHGPGVLVVIEEADKKYITEEHFDSARSSTTESNDRMIAICNPPKDETNAVYERISGDMADDWNTIQFSALNAHNVRVDAGEIQGEKIPGITDLETVMDDWEAYNGEPWPGLAEARAVSLPDSPRFRENLDSRWYRRRAGIMPPARSAAWRPITKANVVDAWDRPHPETEAADQLGTGVDVARSGADSTVALTAADDALTVRYHEPGDNHTQQRDDLHTQFREQRTHPIAVDAIGEGSGLADMLAELFEGVVRFGNGKEPADGQTFYSCWEEGLDLLGDYLAAGGSIDDRDLREELLLASRMVEFEERHYASRGTEVAKATASKEDIKKELGRSPDRLDSALMAVWVRDSGVTAGTPTTTARQGRSEEYGDSDGDAIREAVNEYRTQYENVSTGKW
jgi:hypothetical protein